MAGSRRETHGPQADADAGAGADATKESVGLCTVVRLRRAKGVVVQDCDVYIGRECKTGGWNLPCSKWHNPFTVAAFGAEAIKKFEAYLGRSPRLLAAIPELRGKALGCWCKNRPDDLCHGDILARLANESFGVPPAACPALATSSPSSSAPSTAPRGHRRPETKPP